MSKPPAHLCQSCHCRLDPGDNYCCVCGQKRIDHVPTLRELLGDVLSNVFSLDTKVLRTMRQLLFVPGSLTIAYIKGARQRYYTPFKLFLFVLTLVLLLSSMLMPNFQEHSDEISKKITLFQYQQELRSNLAPIVQDSSEQQYLDNIFFKKEDIRDIKASSFFRMDADNITAEEIYTLSEEELLERYPSKTFFGHLLQRQTIKITKHPGNFQLYIVGHLSWFFFFFVPLLAVWLQLIYVRQKLSYLFHMVFVLHLCTFGLIVLAFGMSLYTFMDSFPNSLGIPLLLIAFVVYAWLALRYSYEQHWTWVSFKWLLLLVGIVLTLFLAVLIVLSLNLFLF